MNQYIMRRIGMGAVDDTESETSVDQGSSINSGATDSHQGLTDSTVVLKDANPSGGGGSSGGGGTTPSSGGGTTSSTVVTTTTTPTNWTRIAEIGAVVAGAGLVGYAVMKRHGKGKHARRRQQP